MFSLESKCANPACATLFDPRLCGKFFRFPRGRIRGLGDGESWTPAFDHHGVEHFWLCESCSAAFGLVYEPQRGVVLRARRGQHPAEQCEELSIA